MEPETTEPIPATVPAQPEIEAPVRKRFPVLIVLIALIALIAIANMSHLIGSKGKPPLHSALVNQPATISPQQMQSFQNMQATQAERDAQERLQRGQTQAILQGAQERGYNVGAVPNPEADSVAPMTSAQSQSIFGNSPNAPQRTSNASQAHAEAQQRVLAREKERQDAINSDTVAIDFGRQAASNGTQPPTSVLAQRQDDTAHASSEEVASSEHDSAQHPDLVRAASTTPDKHDPMAGYPFDQFSGRLYRVFEGTLLEAVVTNHVDGGANGPVLLMLTTDYYSHDHQQLLLPKGTRLVGSVKSVSSQGQRKLMVSFHRAVCPDGFSLEFDNYIGLDPIGTTGLASHVDNHILSSFAVAAAVGGLGGLAQIGNSGSILTPSAELRNGISSQTSQEAEQILNHFLNRLPVITLKEGSRARVYIGRDILIPSYAEHRVDPTL